MSPHFYLLRFDVDRVRVYRYCEVGHLPLSSRTQLLSHSRVVTPLSVPGRQESANQRDPGVPVEGSLRALRYVQVQLLPPVNSGAHFVSIMFFRSCSVSNMFAVNIIYHVNA